MYKIQHFKLIDSTNEYLMGLAKVGERGKLCVSADAQTAGRGRRGRTFASPENGLYMSLLVADLPMDQAMILTPMAAVAVAKGIEKLLGISVGIKWVNDLFYRGKKVCGILTETKFDFVKRRLDYAVIGIGINLCEPEEGFPEELKDIAGALLSEYNAELRDALRYEILLQIEEHIPMLSSPRLIEAYKERSLLLGREITVLSPEGEYQAYAFDIDSMGNLIIEANGERKALSSGEVSIKL